MKEPKPIKQHMALRGFAPPMCFICGEFMGRRPFASEGREYILCGRCGNWDDERKHKVIRCRWAGVPEWPMNHRKIEDGDVYFIQEARGGPVKIGWAAVPLSRLRELQAGNCRRLVLLGTMPGGEPKERELHRQFRDARLRGEWFEPTDELLSFIENHCKEANCER